jgi:hypothetical protein
MTMTNDQAAYALKVMLKHSHKMRRVLDEMHYQNISLSVDENENEPRIVVNTDWYIIPVYFINGNKFLLCWQTQVGVVIPGVHTFRNGDPGYPDDYDYKDIGETGETQQNIMNALRIVLFDILKQEMDNILENISHEEAREVMDNIDAEDSPE